MRQIITKFTDNDLYTFTCQYYILQKYPRAEVQYTFFDRNKTVYPPGFAELLKEQMNYMQDVIITQEEMDYMTKMCPFLPYWYINVFLHGYRFNPKELNISQDEEGHLSVEVSGKWWSTIMWEMPILSTVSELMHIINGDIDKYDKELEYARSVSKAKQALTGGLTIGDMGTRRRFSFEHHDNVIAAFKTISELDKQSNYPGKFTGTSNVYLAMKYNLVPLGTMSHQIISFEENVTGVNECNYNVMKKWSDVYDASLGIFLYDCFGDDIFFKNLSKKMATLYAGLRVDSGNEEEQVHKIVEKYKQLGIDNTQKQVIFSNGLNIDRALDIHDFCKGKVKDSYGIGTFLTCDIKCGKPMNIVVKLTKMRLTEFREWNDCIKLSSDKGKMLGNPEKCKYIMSITHK